MTALARGVIARAAGDDVHRACSPQHGLGLGAEQAGLQRARARDHFQRVGDGAGLLVDLLLHVVLVGTERHSVVAQLRQMLLALHRRPAGVGDAQAVRADLGAIAVFQVDDAASHLHQR